MIQIFLQSWRDQLRSFLEQIEPYVPFIIIAVLLLVGVLIFWIGLAITKADVKTNAKWIFGSFFIQFGVIFFISIPMILAGATGDFNNGGPNLGIMAATIIFSAFIDLQIINVIHKLGMKRSLLIVILVLIPITAALYMLGQNMSSLISLI